MESLLMDYYRQGFLDVEENKYCAGDRLRAGETLQEDHAKAKLDIHGSDPSKIRVDISGFKQEPESVMIHKDRYYKAIKAIPKEFLDVMRAVVIDEKNLPTGREVGREKAYKARWCLCMGLDYLCEHYASLHR